MVDSMPPCTAPYKSRGQKDPSCVVDVTASRPAFIAQSVSSPCATSRRPPSDASWPLTGVSSGPTAGVVLAELSSVDLKTPPALRYGIELAQELVRRARA